MHNLRPRKAICQLACAENSKRASRGLPALWRGNQGKGSAGDHGCFLYLFLPLTVAEVREGGVAHVRPQRGVEPGDVACLGRVIRGSLRSGSIERPLLRRSSWRGCPPGTAASLAQGFQGFPRCQVWLTRPLEPVSEVLGQTASEFEDFLVTIHPPKTHGGSLGPAPQHSPVTRPSGSSPNASPTVWLPASAPTAPAKNKHCTGALLPPGLGEGARCRQQWNLPAQGLPLAHPRTPKLHTPRGNRHTQLTGVLLPGGEGSVRQPAPVLPVFSSCS